jgi:hypothetical protein
MGCTIKSTMTLNIVVQKLNLKQPHPVCFACYEIESSGLVAHVPPPVIPPPTCNSPVMSLKPRLPWMQITAQLTGLNYVQYATLEEKADVGYINFLTSTSSAVQQCVAKSWIVFAIGAHLHSTRMPLSVLLFQILQNCNFWCFKAHGIIQEN